MHLKHTELDRHTSGKHKSSLGVPRASGTRTRVSRLTSSFASPSFSLLDFWAGTPLPGATLCRVLRNVRNATWRQSQIPGRNFALWVSLGNFRKVRTLRPALFPIMPKRGRSEAIVHQWDQTQEQERGQEQSTTGIHLSRIHSRQDGAFSFQVLG